MKTLGINCRSLAKASVIWNTGNRFLSGGSDLEKVLTSGNRHIKRITLKTIDEVALDFSVGAKGLMKEYGTLNFVLGGGIFDSDEIFNAFSSSIKKHAPEINLQRAELGNMAGSVGAGAFALKENDITLIG